jgi:hypothetical protein
MGGDGSFGMGAGGSVGGHSTVTGVMITVRIGWRGPSNKMKSVQLQDQGHIAVVLQVVAWAEGTTLCQRKRGGKTSKSPMPC